MRNKDEELAKRARVAAARDTKVCPICCASLIAEGLAVAGVPCDACAPKRKRRA